MNKGISIAIISIESKKIKTEELYFRNKKYQKSHGCLKNDEIFKQKLNLKNIFFLSFNINFKENKISDEIRKLLVCQPTIKKFFVLCDRDNESYNKKQIVNRIKKLEKIILIDFPKSSVIYLEYENDGDNFETFLSLHFDNRKMFKNYQKNQKNIYQKTMGMGGKNFALLLSNIKKYNQAIKFKQLFKKHENVELD